MELRKRARDGGSQGEVLIIKNSESIAEGAFIFAGSTGPAEEADAVANPIKGLVTGFLDGKGAPHGSGYSSSDVTTFTEAPSGNILAASSDNETVEKSKVAYFPVGVGDIFSGELDATLGTTTGSGIPGYYISVLTSDATKLDESTASTSQQQFRLVDNGLGQNSAIDPQRGGNFVLFEVAEIQNVQTQA
jgi:hypothetical protein